MARALHRPTTPGDYTWIMAEEQNTKSKTQKATQTQHDT